MEVKLITIVSGIPRSGTSMMMQMLKSGGMEILTDNVRKADINNPKGYFELEKVKKLANDNTWLGEAEGKVVKVIAQLLHFLPSEHQYKIIFMERDIKEILKSQEKMLKNMGTQEQSGNSAFLEKAFMDNLIKIKKELASKSNIEVLYVSHRAVIQNPKKQTKIIEEFLGYRLNKKAMAAVVDPKLYRQRIET